MVDLVYCEKILRRNKQIKKIVFSMFVMIILFLTEYSYSSDFFDLNGKQFEINEMDVGRKIGCLPGYYIGVVIRRTSDQKVVWYSESPEEAKNHLIHMNKCMATPILNGWGSCIHFELNSIKI